MKYSNGGYVKGGYTNGGYISGNYSLVPGTIAGSVLNYWNGKVPHWYSNTDEITLDNLFYYSNGATISDLEDWYSLDTFNELVQDYAHIQDWMAKGNNALLFIYVCYTNASWAGVGKGDALIDEIICYSEETQVVNLNHVASFRP